MEKLNLNLSMPQKALNQLIESKINEIIDYINKKEKIVEKEENIDETIDTEAEEK